MGGNLNDGLYYPGLVFIFDKQNAYGPTSDGKVVEVWANRNQAFTLWGQNLLEMNRTSFEQALQAKNIPYVPRIRDIYVESYDMEIDFEEDGRFHRFWLYGYPNKSTAV